MRTTWLLPILVLAACGDNGKTAGPDAPIAIDAPDIDAPIVNNNDGIADARAATDGTGLSLPIKNVTVTYVKPQIGSAVNDPAGFTIQSQKLGPALFIAVDPATLTPVPAVGDVVSFTITAKSSSIISGTSTTMVSPRATAISDLTRSSTGANVSALAQDVSAATDLVSAEDTYDSELVTISGTLIANPSSGGAGFLKAQLSTTGIAADANLQFRAPSGVFDAIDIVNTCHVTATVPIGKFGASIEINPFTAPELTLSGCPAPTVVSAVPLTATTVKITFSRNVLASSIVADGSQFTFDQGLTATAATVNGRTVTVTTSTQSGGLTYVATVANTVTDLQASPLAGTFTANFGGFVAQATVKINEVNGVLANNCDLIELRVIADGSMTGFKLTERTGNAGGGELNFVFPTFNVVKNDIIVVHMSSGSTTCNPGGATSEVTTPTDEPVATHGGNFDTAFDFWATDGGLTGTNNVFTLFDSTGAITDALFVANGAAAAATLTAAGTVGTANQWSPAQTTYLLADYLADAVGGYDVTTTTVIGTSIQRINDTDTDGKADWSTGGPVGTGTASSFGLINVGQTPIP